MKTIRQLTRPVRHWFGYFLIKLLTRCVYLLPLSASQQLGRRVGLLCRLLLPLEKRRVLTQVTQIPSISTVEYTPVMIEKAHWSDLGQRLFEWLSGPKALSLLELTDQTYQELVDLQKQAKQGQAQVILTAHYGHWELMAAYLSTLGFEFCAVASSPPPGPLGHWLSQHRQRLGVQTIHPKGGAHALKKCVKGGGVIALLVDLSTHERKLHHPFLGLEAPLSLTADRLINRFNARAYWLCNSRQANGHYLVKLKKLSPNPLHQYTSENVIKPFDQSLHMGWYTIQAHRLLEEEIRQDPKQWLWLHQRWVNREEH